MTLNAEGTMNTPQYRSDNVDPANLLYYQPSDINLTGLLHYQPNDIDLANFFYYQPSDIDLANFLYFDGQTNPENLEGMLSERPDPAIVGEQLLGSLMPG